MCFWIFHDWNIVQVFHDRVHIAATGQVCRKCSKKRLSWAFLSDAAPETHQRAYDWVNGKEME